MKKIILILTMTISLFAQYEWSDPLQLSRDGVYPELNFANPSITLDNNGALYAFWEIGLPVNGTDWSDGFYSQIEYRKSEDGGLTWSETENLTPEYTTQRIYAIESVCDSKNNVHIVYLRGSENCEVMYKKFDGTSWSEPYEIYPYGGSHLRVGIDNENRINVIWSLGGGSLHSYCDVNSIAPLWSSAQRLHPTDDHFFEGMVFDNNNNLHGIGLLCEDEIDYRPYHYVFDKVLNEWTTIEEINNYDEKLLVVPSEFLIVIHYIQM